MGGGCVSSLTVELEQADDKESLEALYIGGRNISGQRAAPLQRNST